MHRIPYPDDAALHRGFGYRGGRDPAVLVGEGTLREEVERREHALHREACCIGKEDVKATNLLLGPLLVVTKR